jgi:hypothetical protein
MLHEPSTCLHQPLLQAGQGPVLNPSRQTQQGDFVEVAFQTSKGIVQGMAELLAARRQSTSGCLQPFRFVALGDEDHTRLRMVLEAHSDRIAVGGASKAHSL